MFLRAKDKEKFKKNCPQCPDIIASNSIILILLLYAGPHCKQAQNNNNILSIFFNPNRSSIFIITILALY
jgi:hypothetical protein